MTLESFAGKLWRSLHLAQRLIDIWLFRRFGYFTRRLRVSCDHHAAETAVMAKVHPQDHIFGFLIENPVFSELDLAVRYYFRDGQQSAQMLDRLLFDELGVMRSAETSLLEFASGYGCVTRHLTAQLAPVRVSACDIHTAACDFIEQTLGVRAILSSAKPGQLAIGRASFDVVFALSFFSHMPESTWSRWLVTLFDKVKPGGYLVFTTQGLQSRKHFAFPDIPESGFWHIPSSEQKDLDASDYGNTIVTRAFVDGAVTRALSLSVLLFREAGWWGHQDLYVIGKPAHG